MVGLDIFDLDYSFLLIDDKEELCEFLEIKEDRGKDFDFKFNWGINILIFKVFEVIKKFVGFFCGEINLVFCLVEYEILVVNIYDILDFYSIL